MTAPTRSFWTSDQVWSSPQVVSPFRPWRAFLAGFLCDLSDLEGFELLVGEVGAGRSADGGELLDVVPQGVHGGPPI